MKKFILILIYTALSSVVTSSFASRVIVSKPFDACKLTFQPIVDNVLRQPISIGDTRAARPASVIIEDVHDSVAIKNVQVMCSRVTFDYRFQTSVLVGSGGSVVLQANWDTQTVSYRIGYQ